jgi:hypothetical protein
VPDRRPFPVHPAPNSSWISALSREVGMSNSSKPTCERSSRKELLTLPLVWAAKEQGGRSYHSWASTNPGKRAAQSIWWSVRPTPRSPGFRGYGLI